MKVYHVLLAIGGDPEDVVGVYLDREAATKCMDEYATGRSIEARIKEYDIADADKFTLTPKLPPNVAPNGFVTVLIEAIEMDNNHSFTICGGELRLARGTAESVCLVALRSIRDIKIYDRAITIENQARTVVLRYPSEALLQYSLGQMLSACYAHIVRLQQPEIQNP